LVDALEQQPVPLNDEDIMPVAYANRPELRSLHAQQRAVAARASSLRKQYLPLLSANTQYNWTGREYPLQEGWHMGLSLSVPLFDSILTTAQVSEAQANLQGLDAQEDDLRQRITLEVRSSLLELRRADESIRVSQEIEAQASENLALAEGRYQIGVGNITELTDAQAAVTTARASIIQSLYTFKTALAQLEKAIGGSID
jgi:outer membrane protein TolC